MIRYRAPLARKERLAVRDDSITRDARDADHIWLRQSVTFSVNGQTRTLEMALPLRPGATPDEVDALLDEADAGMRRLSQRLDAHLAEVTAAPISAPISRRSGGGAWWWGRRQDGRYDTLTERIWRGKGGWQCATIQTIPLPATRGTLTTYGCDNR